MCGGTEPTGTGDKNASGNSKKIAGKKDAAAGKKDADKKDAGGAGTATSADWVWCNTCQVALFCSRGCLTEAHKQGVHSSQGCSQLCRWRESKLWAHEPLK
jgi:hypothetical protein